MSGGICNQLEDRRAVCSDRSQFRRITDVKWSREYSLEAGIAGLLMDHMKAKGSMNMIFDIEEELKKLPGKPGVYIMHGEKDEIIYVGKAVSLKNRVRQYFQSSRNKGAKIEQMVTHITRFEYIVTDSELEALVLECNLIKEHRPKYNTMLKDDKTYPFIKVTVQEALSESSVFQNHEKG